MHDKTIVKFLIFYYFDTLFKTIFDFLKQLNKTFFLQLVPVIC